MEELFTLSSLFAFLALAALEIVLGIDNLVLIAVLSEKLPEEKQNFARKMGLFLAMLMRIGLLFAIAWLMTLTETLFEIPFLPGASHGAEGAAGEAAHGGGHAVSGKDLILIAGGAFLLWKATHEIHKEIEGEERHDDGAPKKVATIASVITQILLMDLVFSLDSVITAVGMTDKIPVMIAAVMVAVGTMIIFANPIARFIKKHPTTKMLALAFLLLVGVLLVADGFGQHVPRGYVYTAMAFSLFVEVLNLKAKTKRNPTPKRLV